MSALAHLWDVFRIYTDISARRLRKTPPARLPASQKYILFLDNRFPDHFSQVEFLFRSGFLRPETTTILSRFYVSSVTGLLTGRAKYGFGLEFFTTLASIPQPPVGSVVLYPYNGQANSRMMLNRESIHIFVGHGDSNKKASVNPMLRAYDHVFVTGELQRHRLIDQHILRPEDLAGDRMIALGDCLIDAHQAAGIEHVPHDHPDASIVYLPTWEGGFERENYCSIGEPNTARLLVSLAGKLGVRRVVIDVHPNLGSRRSEYGAHLVRLTENLLAHGLAVDVVRAENKTSAVKPLGALLRARRIGAARAPVKAAYAIVDVSATESIVAASGTPSLVAWKDVTDIFGSRLYWRIRRQQIVRLSEAGDIDRAVARALTREDLREQAEFAEALFGYQQPDLLKMSPAERSAWLHACVVDLQARGKTRVMEGITIPGLEAGFNNVSGLFSGIAQERTNEC
ncbi:hypothetical protein J2Y48_002906 [Mycoplana sp. BE70]|uniref:hypothetical protein n=1 Tax=Mycoplana sp. BE70 TaxID=2817775 RepID=UPI0028587041|nr:hypothetical protein [Mycoplana sp. BE70]MDR6757609.1 hypothetical protein [Mycoplana sp. BE70]